MYRVQSVYSNDAHDRRWDFRCKSLKIGYAQCAETDYVNTFDYPLYFMCGTDQYIGGVNSYHGNLEEDRRWKFQCCSITGYKMHSCRLTGYVNDINQPLGFEIGSSEVIAGVYSYHDNSKE